MRSGLVCVAAWCWASIAVAQVSLVRSSAADTKVAAALEQLIGEPVSMIEPDAEIGAHDARVSIDRRRASLNVASSANPAGLTRALDDALLTSSPYAVALAAAELLDLLRALPASAASEPARRDPQPPAPTPTGGDDTPSPPDARTPAAAASDVRPAVIAAQRNGADRPSAKPEPEPERNATPAADTRDATRADEAPEPDATDTGDVAAPGAPASHHASRLDYAFGVDLELQSQPSYDLSFVRPVIYGELAAGRAAPGPFWAAGARVSAPAGTELQPTAAGVAAGSSVRALAWDAALEGTLGYVVDRLAFTAHLAAGLAYLHVEALDPQREALGHDTQFSPLLGAGVGTRFSVALGFALAVRGEAQWAGPPTEYSIGGMRVLEGGQFRVGLLAGIIWESALGRSGP